MLRSRECISCKDDRKYKGFRVETHLMQSRKGEIFVGWKQSGESEIKFCDEDWQLGVIEKTWFCYNLPYLDVLRML